MRNRKSIRTPSQDRKSAVRITLCVAGILIAGITAWWMSREPELDQATLCPLDRPLQTSVIVLVDTTDALNRLQVKRMLATVKTTLDGMPVFGKLSIVLLDGAAPYEPVELVSLCNPGSPNNINPLLKNPRRYAKKYQEAFGAPVEKALAALITAPTAARSPIMETLTALTWRPDFDASVPDRSLVIVSDMLQHQPGGMSHYQSAGRWARFMHPGLPARDDANLAGVSVRVDYIRRPDVLQLQNAAHRQFWTTWLTGRGASSVTGLETAGAPPGNIAAR